MKKTLLTFVLIIATAITTTAQATFTLSAGIDPLNAYAGSKPTNYQSKVDYKVRLLMRDKHAEVFVQYENFAAIDYQNYFIGTNYVFTKQYLVINKDHVLKTAPFVELTAGAEYGIIQRQYGQTYLGYGANAETRIYFKTLGIGLQANYAYRPENHQWQYSTTANLLIRL